VPPLPSGMPAPLLAPGPALWRLHAVWGVASAASLGAPPRGFVLGAPLLAGGSEVDALEAAEAAALRVELLQKAPPAAPAGLLGDGASLGRSPFDFRIDSAGRAPRRAGRVRSHHKGGLVRPATTATAQEAQPLSERLRGLRWLHVPKTGTSFIATIWNYACGQRGVPLDLYVDDYYTKGCSQCYDFAVMDRYPKQHYCEPGVLSSSFATQHRPAAQWEFVSESVVGFFRRPAQRLISAHRNGFHASGLGSAAFRRLREGCGGAVAGAGCFARWPGIAGCSARMLTGLTCADPAAEEAGQRWDRGLGRVEQAVANLAKMRFVGLTEDWDESVCLFHRMFGGRVNPAEFKDFHPHPGKSEDYDEAELGGFVDEADELVYAAAARRFAALKAEYVEGDRSACGDDLESSLTSVQGGNSSAQELSCGARGAQCGLLDDQLDCGRCPPGRLAKARSGETAPACSANGKCAVSGSSASPEMFSWYLS